MRLFVFVLKLAVFNFVFTMLAVVLTLPLDFVALKWDREERPPTVARYAVLWAPEICIYGLLALIMASATSTTAVRHPDAHIWIYAIFALGLSHPYGVTFMRPDDVQGPTIVLFWSTNAIFLAAFFLPSLVPPVIAAIARLLAV